MILKKVILDKSYVSIELNKALQKNPNVNTALVTKIVYGVLEKDITLEYFVECNVNKMPKPEILILLKMVGYVSKTIKNYTILLNKSMLVFDRLQFKLRTSDGLQPSKEIRYLSFDSFITEKRSIQSSTKLSDDIL